MTVTSQDERLMDPIAAFIGARLHYPNPEVNGQGNVWVSTIHVQQHKEKFFFVRVYCTLAADHLVKEKWRWLLANKELIAKRPARYFPKVDLSLDEAPLEFHERCLKADALHYRSVYMDMVSLQPQLMGRICGQADHVELLRPTLVELLAELNDGSDRSGLIEHLCKKYKVPSFEGLQRFLTLIYEPSTKERHDLRV